MPLCQGSCMSIAGCPQHPTSLVHLEIAGAATATIFQLCWELLLGGLCKVYTSIISICNTGMLASNIRCIMASEA